ncbi:hypothetical protein, partial [Escherichia coli]|uniref:hypothetical protein n=1 Tax=Escherichia coli TaxID=562 RepID=UPI0019665A54
RVTTFVMDSGERYCMVVDRASGLPMHSHPINITQLQGTLYVKNHQFIQDTFSDDRNKKPLN